MSHTESDSLAQASILVVSHGFQTAYERGFCNAIAANGARVVLAASDNTDHLHMHTGVEVCNVRGSQDASRPKWEKVLNLAKYRVRLLALAFRERKSLVHVIGITSFPLLSGIADGLLFRMICSRYILTVHNLLPHDKHTFWNRKIFQWLYRIPNTLIVHTETMRDQLVRDFGVACSKIVVMQHGCELEDSFSLPPRPPEKSSVRILFFGGISRYKGVDVLLEALADLPKHYELKIYGFCREIALREEIEARIRELSEIRPISWRNEYVSEEEMASVLSWADILALPYRHIDQSGVIFQALKFGVPMVATRVGEFPNIITRELGELCEPNDARSLRTAILCLAERAAPVSREYIASQAKRYDWTVTVQSLSAVYG